MWLEERFTIAILGSLQCLVVGIAASREATETLNLMITSSLSGTQGLTYDRMRKKLIKN